MADAGYLTIGKVVKRLRPQYPDLSISKVRYLEDEGLISPLRSTGGYRKYSPKDVARLESILYMQKHRFYPLAVIKEHADESPVDQLHPLLQEANALFEENIPMWTHLADNLSTDQMIDIIADSLGPAIVNAGLAKEEDMYRFEDLLALARIRYALAGGLSLYTFWLKNGCREPVEAVSKIIEDAAKKGIYPL